ncbi:MAG: hypothetical protein ACK5OX_03180 [Desertimonas sp.]
MSPPGRRRPRPLVPFAEGVVTAIAGGALAASVGVLVARPVPAGFVGAVNGAVSGARGVYRWRRPEGWVAFVLDSTWGLAMTTVAVGAHAVAATQQGQGGYVEPLSRRQNRHVYERGVRVRRGFVLSLGNTISQVGASVRTSPPRLRMVTDHEDVHVWQARWLGPIFPVLYAGWSVAGGVVGIAVWAARRRSEPLGQVVETCAYYLNPLEWWAYSREDRWPPPGKLAGLGWRRPAARAFSVGGGGRWRAASPSTPP